MTQVNIFEDDLFIYCATHDDDMVITYDPDSTPVSQLAKAMEHAILMDMHIDHQWFDTDLNRQVLHMTRRVRHG